MSAVSDFPQYMKTNKILTHVGSEPLMLAAFSDMPSCLYVNLDEWWQLRSFLRFVSGCFLTKSVLCTGEYIYLTIQIFAEFITEKRQWDRQCCLFILKEDQQESKQRLPPHNAVILCNPCKSCPLISECWCPTLYKAYPLVITSK